MLIFFFLAIAICLVNDKARDRRDAKLAAGLSEAELNIATSAEDLATMGYVAEEKN